MSFVLPEPKGALVKHKGTNGILTDTKVFKGTNFSPVCSCEKHDLIRGRDNNIYSSRDELEKRLMREDLKKQLLETIEQQTLRIEKLKNETTLELENEAGIRRSELENRLNSSLSDIRVLIPKVEAKRADWESLREQTRGFEMQCGTMRSQHQQTLGNISALRDQMEQHSRENKTILTEIDSMTEHVARIQRDKATMNEKIKRALECVVIDENLLNNRLSEERRYTNDLTNALRVMQSEYMEYQQYNSAELSPLDDDINLLTGYLEEMKERTKDALRYYFDIVQKANNLDVSWINDLRVVDEALEKSNALYRLKATIVAMLEGHMRKMPENIKPKQRSGLNDKQWLTCYLDVWNLIVREIASEKIKHQRSEGVNNSITIASQQLEASKNELQRLKREIEGDGTEKLILFHQLRSLNFLESQKKTSEWNYISDVNRCTSILNEDTPKILHYIQKESFDDYVSSTDEDEEEYSPNGDKYPILEEEGNADIAAIISSYELDPEDPESVEIISKNLHRPQGPLDSYLKMKKDYLLNVVDVTPQKSIKRKPYRELMETLERVVLPIEEDFVNKYVSDIRTRAVQIQRRELDPRNEEVLVSDPAYSERAKELSLRLQRWVTQQKEAPIKFRDGLCEALLSSNAPANPAKLIHPVKIRDRIVIKDAHVPTDIEKGTPLTKAVYFLNMAVKGVRLMYFPKGTLQPQLRHIFLSRDLTRVIARRVGIGALSDNRPIPVAMGDDADVSLRVQDIFTILLGHRSVVFHDAKLVSKSYMSEDLAFSLMSTSHKTIDVECNSAWDRNMWANVMAFVINESRSDGPSEERGIISKLVRGKRIAVVDVINRTPNVVEISERGNLQVIVN